MQAKKNKNNKISDYPIPKTCLYCNSKVIFTSNKEIYGKVYGNGKCYKCTKCDAFVGIHTGTKIPLGRLANKELRELKIKAHNLFDPIWKDGNMKRSEAYASLARELGIPKKECHFGWFDKEMLNKAIVILNKNKPKKKSIPPEEMLKEISLVLTNEPDKTDEWGNNFIKSLLKSLKDKKNLTERQLYYLEIQYKKIVNK